MKRSAYSQNLESIIIFRHFLIHFIRSDLQLALMKNGGNQRLQQFFEYYKMPKDAPIDFKYKTKAGIYYREAVKIHFCHKINNMFQLKAVAEGKNPPQAPSEVEGLELVGSISPPLNLGLVFAMIHIYMI